MPTLPSKFQLRDDEISIIRIRAQGPGGQGVNKVSSAVHLRFDIRASSLPEEVKSRLLQLCDQRISANGIVVIKAQQYRSLDRNRSAAMERLHGLIAQATHITRVRRATRPTRSSRKLRVEEKIRRGKVKALRSRAGIA